VPTPCRRARPTPARSRSGTAARRLRCRRAGFQAARSALARCLVGRFADGAGRGTTRQAAGADRGLVAQLRRSRTRRAGRRGAAHQPERAHGRHAHHGGARATGDRRQPALPAAAAGDRQGHAHGNRGEQRAGYCADGVQHRLRRRLGDRFLGQVPAQHRSRGCRLLRHHRAVRRPAGADRGAGRDPLRVDPHPRNAADDRARKRRTAEAQPGDHRAPLQARQRLRTRCAAGEVAVPRHPRHDPADRGQPAPDAERALRPARPPAGCAARNGGRQGPHSADRAGDRCRHAGRDAAPPPRCARRRAATGGPVGADRRQRRRPLPIDRAARLARPLVYVAVGVAEEARLGDRPQPGVERLRLRSPEQRGAGAGCPLPAALRAVPSDGAAGGARGR